MYKLIYLLLNRKITFKKIDNCSILLVDTIFENTLKNILKKKINTLKIRFEEISIYVLARLFFSKKKMNFFNYVVTYIEISNPKLIITGNDNLFWFYKLKIIFPKIKFASIQNGFRNKLFFKKLNKKSKRKKLSCDYIFTHNKPTANLFKKYIKTKTVEIGSIINNSIKVKKNINKKDILFVSDGFPSNDRARIFFEDGKTFFYEKKNYKKEILLIKNLLKYCKTNNFKLTILPKNFNYLGKKEIEFYKTYFFNEDIKFVHRVKKNYSNRSTKIYKLADKSSITITTASSFGFENIARRNRTIIFNIKRTVTKNILDLFWNFNMKKKGYFWTDQCSLKEVRRLFNNFYKNKGSSFKTYKIPLQLMNYDYNNKILTNKLMQLSE